MKKIIMLFSAGVLLAFFTAALPRETVDLTSDETIPLVKGNTVTAAALTQTAQETKKAEKKARKLKLDDKQTKKKTSKKTVVKKELTMEEIVKNEEAKKVEAEKKAADEAALNTLLEKMTAAQAERRAIKAVINITSTYGEGSTQDVTGDIIIKKDEKFYIHYKKPTEQLMISNGKTLWVYTPEMNQVMKQDLSKAALNTKFYVEMENSIVYYTKKSINKLTEEKDYYTLSMKPKDRLRAQYDEIICRIDKEDYFPSRMTMKSESVAVEVKFSQVVKFTKDMIEKEPDLKDSKFEFTAPQGVEEIEAESIMNSVDDPETEKTPAKSGKEK